MGFININGQSVHTSSLSSSLGITSSTITTTATNGTWLSYGGNTMNIGTIQNTYHILGEDVKVSSYLNPQLVVAISTLNILGKPFYDELKKNNFSFPDVIEEYLKKKFTIIERDRKINEVLK